MNTNPLVGDILAALPFEPNPQQAALAAALAAYAAHRLPRDVFVLNGYAGTGKTSLVGAFVKALAARGRKVEVLAPTGRAAKVAAAMAGRKASTIHKRIFRGNGADPSNTRFFLAPNQDPDTIFIVDEASMVTDSPDTTQSILQLLLRHVFSAPGCGLVFVGDLAQLPPVGMERSFAMDRARLTDLGLNPVFFHLDIPARQAAGSGILCNATTIRMFLFSGYPVEQFRLSVKGLPDVMAVSSAELADCLADSWSEVGAEETLIVTRSNRRANNFNKAIRSMVMYADEPIQQGDRLVVAKNDYFWSRVNKLPSFIANGETAEVTWVGKTEKAYGRWFVDVELRLTDTDRPVAAKIMLRSLVAEGPAIERREMEMFYQRVLNECDGVASHKIKAALEDPYYNALQVKYAYCVTCHKAQGGQWRHVYIDMGAIPKDAIGPEFFRWLYTAVTRATQRLFFINPTVPCH